MWGRESENDELVAPVPHLPAHIEGDVLVLDHVLDLPAHRERKEHEEVHDEDRPVHRHVEHRREGAEQRNQRCARRGEPELPLWQPPHEWPEFVVTR